MLFMGLFNLKTIYLFLLFWLPFLVLSNKSTLAPILMLFLAAGVVANVIFSGRYLQARVNTAINLNRFYLEGAVILVAEIVSIVLLATAVTWQPGWPVAGLIGSFALLAVFVDFADTFSKLLYTYLNREPAAWDKLLMVLSMAFFPIGVFYIKKLLHEKKYTAK